MTATRPSFPGLTSASTEGAGRARRGRPVRVLGSATWLNLTLVVVVAGREIGSVLGDGSGPEDPLVGARVATVGVLVLTAAYGVVCLRASRSRVARRRRVLLAMSVLTLVTGLACGAACLSAVVSASSSAPGLTPGPMPSTVPSAGPFAGAHLVTADLVLGSALGVVLWAVVLAGAARLTTDVLRTRTPARHRDFVRTLT
ncbi:hypothetical protein KLP28_00325 [Nocardioidaceae bacterium]|nr:hypothetical protein KLP28_00325 [Nocardioidaceae bacterium]